MDILKLSLTLAIMMLPFYGLALLVGFAWPIKADDGTGRRRLAILLLLFGALSYTCAVIFLTHVFSAYLVGCASQIDPVGGQPIHTPEPGPWMYGLGCRTDNALLDAFVVAALPTALMLLASHIGGRARRAISHRGSNSPA